MTGGKKGSLSKKEALKERSRQDEDVEGGETYPTTAFFISDQGATNHLTTTLLEHLQHLQATPSWAEQQALKDSWGSLPAGGTANS